MKKDFLLEIGCCELPAKQLPYLQEQLKIQFEQALKNMDLTYGDITVFAAPRRLALLISNLISEQPTRRIERRGPAKQAAFDAEGQPTKAAIGFAKSCGCAVEALQVRDMEKGAWLFYTAEQVGKKVEALLPGLIEAIIDVIPLPKRMRWGKGDYAFLRQIRWMTLLYGKETVPMDIYGVKTDKVSYGHRFHHPDKIELSQPSEYEDVLYKKGKVIVAQSKRQQLIQQQAEEIAKKHGGKVLINENLLIEVAGLVEWPVVLLVEFEKKFLAIPQEVLISAMQDHQKCFPIVDKKGKLLAKFITVSNIESSNPEQVIVGNERVMRARLADAEFFYHVDCKQRLLDRAEKMHHVIFQAKLGTLHDKVERIEKLAIHIAGLLNIDEQKTSRAARLCKADLLSDMVEEFPELQGTMGYYYALNDGEDNDVAVAIREHYLPRFAKDALPESNLGLVLALADRLDTIVGIFGINQMPTGEKDPFGLRRAALAVLRILIEKTLPLDLVELLTTAVLAYKIDLPNKTIVNDCLNYMLERLRAYFLAQDITADTFAAVMAKKPTSPLDFYQRIEAVKQFRLLPEASALAAANKRVTNLLGKAEKDSISTDIMTSLFESNIEQELAALLQRKREEITPLIEKADYAAVLLSLSSLRTAVDDFFDNVMVMVDDKRVCKNRLAILANLRELFLEVADIALLAEEKAA